VRPKAKKAKQSTQSTQPSAKRPKVTNKKGSYEGIGVLASAVRNDAERDELAHCAYLSGFLNPDFAALGPIRDNEPQLVATFRSRTQFEVGPPTVPGETARSWPSIIGNPSHFPLNSNGAIGFCISPCFFVDDSAGNSNANVPAALSAGFSFDPDFSAPDDLVVKPFTDGYTAGVVRPWPLNEFNSAFPGTPGVIYSPTTADASLLRPDRITGETHRLVGLRSTLTCTTAPLTATSSIIAGDGEAYHTPDMGLVNVIFDSGLNTDVAVTPTPSSYYDGLFTVPISSGEKNPRLTSLGMGTAGSIFECQWLPTNDDALQFDDVLPTFVSTGNIAFTNTAVPQSYPYPNMASLVGNWGSNIWVLRNVPVFSTFVLEVTAAYQVGVRVSGSPIGFLMNQARLARSYIVDWRALSGIMSASRLGVSYRAWMGTNKGRIGHMMLIGELPQAPGNVPVMQGVGAISPFSGASVDTTFVVNPQGTR